MIHITAAIALFFVNVLVWEIMRMAAVVAGLAMCVLLAGWFILRAARRHLSRRE